MTESQFGTLLTDLWADLHQPAILWQAGTLILCLLGAAVLVGYRTDMAEALRILVDVARVHPRVLKAPEPTAQVLSLADSGVDLELGFWIEDPERGSQNVRSDVSLALLAEFRARGIEIPYPQREVRLVAVPDEK